jgi:hypothetical protein
MEKSKGFYLEEAVAVRIGWATFVAVILLACVIFLQDLSGINPEGQEAPVAIVAGEK